MMPLNPMQLLQQFTPFMQEMKGKDPNQLLNEMISKGVNQSQLNQAQQVAQQISGQLNQFKSMFGFK